MMNANRELSSTRAVDSTEPEPSTSSLAEPTETRHEPTAVLALAPCCVLEAIPAYLRQFPVYLAV